MNSRYFYVFQKGLPQRSSNISVPRQPLAAAKKIWKEHPHFTPLIPDVPLRFDRWKHSSSSESGCQIGQPDETGREEVLFKMLRDGCSSRCVAGSCPPTPLWFRSTRQLRGGWRRRPSLTTSGRKLPSPSFHRWGNHGAERESDLSRTWNVSGKFQSLDSQSSGQSITPHCAVSITEAIKVFRNQSLFLINGF